MNTKRVWMGAVAGGLGFAVWDFVCAMGFHLPDRYAAAQTAGTFLKESRYPVFMAQWELALFLCAVVCAFAYGYARKTMGPGPGSAVKLGAMIGFVGGFPLNLAQAAWTTGDRVMPLAWMLDIWIGCVVATVIAGLLYKDE